MSVPTPKHYQQDAVNNALEIFRYAENQIQQATDAASRRTASAFNGCVLLEAPTGAGKTMMAGMIAEAFAAPDHHHNAKIVWFWFTPFATLVEQSKSAMKEHFTGLRVRDLANERVAYSSRSGDVFLTTWQSVAAKRADTRKLRKNGDTSLALDDFIPALREAGFRIGVVVDEAHHGFTGATEAVRFYREVLAPEFTLLITATPDDADVVKFKKAAGIGELHRITVSRQHAVDAGLIKGSVKAIAYLATDDQKPFTDIPATALAEAWQAHSAIKAQLAEIGATFTPLMLVQVGNKGPAGVSVIEDAKAKLLNLGVPESAIASYTADEPHDDLATVAFDDSKEVLLFKMAVALGFDAPRAFTVVSMRGAKDTDFGVQVVGRILRVHRQLQAKAADKTLPELLRFGYVFLAEPESQSGLIGAGERINALQTELSGISPYALTVRVGGETQVQYSQNGQMALLPQPYVPPAWKPAGSEPAETAPNPATVAYSGPGILPGFSLIPQAETAAPYQSHSATITAPLPGASVLPLREGIPTYFQKEQLPLETDVVKCAGVYLKLSGEVLQAGLRKTVRITRKTVADIFDSHTPAVDTVQAKLSHAELARRAQRVLFQAEYYNPRDLEDALLAALRLEYNDEQGIGLDDGELRRALNLILATYPNLVRDSVRVCMARDKEILDAAPLPAHVEALPGAVRSRLNVYGVMPPDLNEHERKFAEFLDADTSGTVLWWHRNPSRKPWSIRLIIPEGDGYYPDFVIGVKNRTRGGGILLAEIKGGHILDSEETREKARAEHKTYGPPVLLTRRDDGKFWIARYIPKENRVEPDQVFRVEHMGQY
ncbi:DEAD/DEAH box helicase [Methylomagnum sp.]